MEFGRGLFDWTTALHDIPDSQVIAINVKSLRRSFGSADGKAAVPMVGIWATANHIRFGRVVVVASVD